MKFRKQIIIAISCVVILGGAFWAVSYLGNKDQAKEAKNNTANSIDLTKEKAGNENKKSSASDVNSKDKTASEQVNITNKTENEKEVDAAMKEVKEGYYVVKADDTLYSIARTYMPNSEPSEVVAEILTRNKMSKNDVISQGQKLIISYETSLESKSEDKSTAANSTDHSSHTKYVVKSGDTLFSIAKKYLASMNVIDGVKLIKEHNNINDENTIKVQETICIPNK